LFLFTGFANHGRMARDGHGLPKVLLGPAMPDPSTPCGRATPVTALTTISGVACPQGSRPAAVFYAFGHHTPYDYIANAEEKLRSKNKGSEMI
jgi:hypothetical protein